MHGLTKVLCQVTRPVHAAGEPDAVVHAQEVGHLVDQQLAAALENNSTRLSDVETSLYRRRFVPELAREGEGGVIAREAEHAHGTRGCRGQRQGQGRTVFSLA